LEYVEGLPVGAAENPRKLFDVAIQIADGLRLRTRLGSFTVISSQRTFW
jgi:hypothetical protein